MQGTQHRVIEVPIRMMAMMYFLGTHTCSSLAQQGLNGCAPPVRETGQWTKQTPLPLARSWYSGGGDTQNCDE